MEAMHIHDRLLKMLKDLDISGSVFDAKCGFSRGYLLKTIKRKADVGYEKLMKILTVFEEYSPQWLLMGKGEMKLSLGDNDIFLKKLKEIQKEYPAMCIADSEGRVIKINDVYSRQTGYKLKDIKGKRPGDYLRHTDFPEDLRRKIKMYIKSRDAFYEQIYPNYHKLCFPIICQLFVFPIIYNDKVDGFLSFANFKNS